MGFFNRNQSRGPAVLGDLDLDQADELHTIAVNVLASLGRNVQTQQIGILVSTDDQRSYGLHNLAVHLGNIPRRNWERAVRDHFTALISHEDSPGEAAASQILLKLRATGDLMQEPAYPLEEVLPGIVAVVAVDYPTHVVENHSLETLPTKTWEVTSHVARANLSRLPDPVHHEVQVDPRDLDSVVHVLATDDFYGASRLLVLDQFVDIDRSNGILVAVPNRHLLAVHAPTGTGIVGAIEMMASMAKNESESAGPLSPHVYYIAPDGTQQTITRHGLDGQMSVIVEGPLLETFIKLGLIGEPDED